MKGFVPVTATTQPTKVAGISTVYQYLSDGKTNGYSMAQFTVDWRGLDPLSKKQLLDGIINCTLTY